jgi:hypothetical protein
MNPRIQAALALLAAVTLNLGTARTWGFYSLSAFLAVMASLLLGIAACIPWEKWWPIAIRRTNWLVVLTAMAACLLGIVAVNDCRLMYVDDPKLAKHLSAVNSAIILITAVAFLVRLALLNLLSRRGRLILDSAFLVTMLAASGYNRYVVIEVSPEPVIDVYNLLRDGADHVIAGKNPYATDIESPYGTARAEYFNVEEPPDTRPAGYPPLPLLLCVPPRLFKADVRWSNIAGYLLGGLAIGILGFRRGQPGLGLLATAIFLNLPRTEYIIEQTWYEPMIAGLLGIGLVLAECRSWVQWLGYTLVGFGLTAKQFGLPLFFPLAWSHRRNWRQILVGLAIAGLFIIPWFIWSPADFLDILLWKHLDRQTQYQSITVTSFMAKEFRKLVPRQLGWVEASAAILAISYVTPRNGAAAAVGLGSALLAFCVFHTQGFPNYFYLVQYLWLLGFVGLLPMAAPNGPGLRGNGLN